MDNEKDVPQTGSGAEDGVVTGPSSLLPHKQHAGFGDVHESKTLQEAAAGSAEEFREAVGQSFAPSVPEGQQGHGAIMERSQAEHDRIERIKEKNRGEAIEAAGRKLEREDSDYDKKHHNLETSGKLVDGVHEVPGEPVTVTHKDEE